MRCCTSRDFILWNVAHDVLLRRPKMAIWAFPHKFDHLYAQHHELHSVFLPCFEDCTPYFCNQNIEPYTLKANRHHHDVFSSEILTCLELNRNSYFTPLKSWLKRVMLLRSVSYHTNIPAFPLEDWDSPPHTSKKMALREGVIPMELHFHQIALHFLSYSSKIDVKLLS